MKLFSTIHRKMIYHRALSQVRHLRETAAEEAIDRLIAGYADEIPYLRNLRARLVGPVKRALRYTAHLARQIPGPVELVPSRWSTDPLINAVCTDPDKMSFFLTTSKELRRFFGNPAATEAIAVLTARKKEKVVTGVEKDGEIVRRDVLQKAVYFEEQHITAPAPAPEETRRQIQQQLLEEFFTETAAEFADLKSWKADLEEQKARLKLVIGKAADDDSLPVTTPHDKPADDKDPTRVYKDIKAKLAEIEDKIGSPDVTFERLARLLRDPQSYLNARVESLSLSRLGIKLKPTSEERANVFSFAAFKAGEQKEWIAVLIRIHKDDFLSLPAVRKKPLK